MKPRVFLLEDDVSLIKEVCKLLEENGFQVDHASSLARAKEQWRQFQPDICLLDLKLPDGSGLEFLDILMAEGSGTSALMFSGYGNIPLAVEAIKHGAEDFLTKPIEPDHFLFRLRKLVEQRKQRAELDKTNRHLKQSQMQLLQSHKMATIGKITAGITHEINSPIGVIKSNLDTLSRGIIKLMEMLNRDIDAKKHQEYQRIVKTLEKNNEISAAASDRIANLVRTLRSFTRLDAAEFDKVNIEQGLEDSLTLIRHEIKDGIKVTKDFGNVPDIWCYLSELNQVFMVLLRNALQAIKKKGTISISTSCQNQRVIVKIQDSGVGIPPEGLSTLFDLEFTVRDNRVGMPMGLISAYNIIQKHHGELKVESQEGKGTTFTIILPADLKRESFET